MAGDDAKYLRGRRPRANHRGNETVRLVDLFSGIGGLTLGVEEACRQLALGLEVRLAVECNAEIARAYADNFLPSNGAATDVSQWFDRSPSESLSTCERKTRATVGVVDILVGGPPCQGHSTLNNYTRGDDPKNELYHAVIRAAEVLEPDCVLIENVPAIERDARGTLARATERLLRLGYLVDSAVVCVSDIGVPQLRSRHVLAARRRIAPSIVAALQAVRARAQRTVRWAIEDLVDVRPRGILDDAAGLSRENQRRAEFLIAHDQFDLPNRLRPKCQRGPHKYKSMYGRLAWDAPAQTITTGFGSPGQGRYFHPSRPRALTPHEAARLQFLPDWLDLRSIVHRKKLAAAIGNAVPPKLAFAIAASLLDTRRARAASLEPKPNAPNTLLQWSSRVFPSPSATSDRQSLGHAASSKT
jgi:DNA (cytosine-5)-methyltransferase 1